MSSYYKLSLSLILKKDLADEERAILEFMINGHGETPEHKPSHSYFEVKRSVFNIPLDYNGFAEDRFVSKYSPQGLVLLMPSIKDLQGWFDTLKYVDWLCSLTHQDSFIGYIVKEEEPLSVSFLYSVKKSLYLNDEQTPHRLISFLTGEILENE